MTPSKGLNKVMVIGWLEDDPDVRQTPAVAPWAAFSVATSRSWASAEGEKHEEKSGSTSSPGGLWRRSYRSALPKVNKFTSRVDPDPRLGRQSRP